MRIFVLASLISLCLPLPMVRAATPNRWVPVRWQGGPLEIVRREKAKTLPADPKIRDSIEKWYEPDTLELLSGTPVNCLLVTWSASAEAAVEEKQHQIVKTYAGAARGRGMAVLGLVYPGADASSVVSSALDAQLDGLVLEGNFPGGMAFPQQVRQALKAKNSAAVVIPVAGREVLLRTTEWPILAASDGVWPRVKVVTDAGVTAGPTGDPWLDSNVWRVQSLRAASLTPPVWLGHVPDNPSSEDYPRAVADAAVAGGRWILALDDALRYGLRQKQPEALATWRRTLDHLKFYEDHAAWRRFSPHAGLAIAQDASGENIEMSGENLTMFSRRQIPHRIINRPDLSPTVLAGLQTLVAMDLASPTPAERKLLSAFAEGGGLLVVGPSWKTPTATAKSYSVEATGKGRTAIYKDAVPDPSELSLDVITLLGKGNLPLRLFNASSMVSYVSADSGGKRVLLGLVEYSGSPVESVTVRIAGDFRTARLYSPEAPVVTLPVAKSDRLVEIAIPKVSVCAALLLE